MEEIPGVTEGQVDRLVEFIESTVANAGCDGVVVGLSGGLDSAVVAKLATLALGEKVLTVFLPTDSAPKNDYSETEEFSRSIGSEYKVVKIQRALDALVGEDDGKTDIGNYAARIRMAVLFNCARKRNYLVLGTSNKSEISIGYFTKFGDGACDAQVLSELYKTQVRSVAEMIGIPEKLIKKTPTAGFWKGQTDEKDIGTTYDKLDLILSNPDSDDSELSKVLEISENTVAEIRKKVSNSEHKRTFPAHPE